jgi:hypothetical protein
MLLAFIHGPAASGKYTIGRQVADALGWPLFHNHLTVDLVRELFPFGAPAFRSLRERIWLDTFEEAARSDQSLVFTFQPESTVAPAFIDRAVETVEARGGAVAFVELTCPDDVVEARIEDEGRAAFGKLRSAEFHRELRRSGDLDFPPLPKPLITIATDEVEPDEAAALVIEALRRVDG